MVFAVRLIVIPRLKAGTQGNRRRAGVVGAIIWTIMFACLVSTLFLTNDKQRLIDSGIVASLALIGGCFLIYAESAPRR